MTWSTSTVREEVAARAAGLGMRVVHEDALPCLADIDTAQVVRTLATYVFKSLTCHDPLLGVARRTEHDKHLNVGQTDGSYRFAGPDVMVAKHVNRWKL